LKCKKAPFRGSRITISKKIPKQLNPENLKPGRPRIFKIPNVIVNRRKDRGRNLKHKIS